MGARVWRYLKAMPRRSAIVFALLVVLPGFAYTLPPGLSRVATILVWPISTAAGAVADWSASHVLGLPDPAATSFGTTRSWILLGSNAVLAAIVAIGWTLFAPVSSAREHSAHGWTRLLVRLSVAGTLCTYGLWKVLQIGQFDTPSLHRLLTPVGDLTPAALMWAFMGASPAYKLFTGFAEVGAGLLLFSRRTTTLGATLAVGVMSNVVMMNFAYDVPVKDTAVRLLVLSVFLLAPDLWRLTEVLVLERTSISLPPPAPRFSGRGELIMRAAVGTFAGWTLYAIVSTMYSPGFASWLRKPFSATNTADVSPFSGIYEVQAFSRNRTTLPPLATDTSRWWRIAIEVGGAATVWRGDGTQRSWFTFVDTAQHRLTMVAAADTVRHWLQPRLRAHTSVRAAADAIANDSPNRVASLAYSIRADTLWLRGRLGADSLEIRARVVPVDSLLLLRWRTHLSMDGMPSTTLIEQPYPGVLRDPRRPELGRVDAFSLFSLRDSTPPARK